MLQPIKNFRTEDRTATPMSKNFKKNYEKSISMFSCSVDSVDANDALYETQATEGDDGDDEDLPPPPPPIILLD